MRLKVVDNLELRVHYMNLHNDPFMKISNKTKTIEMRLNDEKRQQLKVDDYIIFTNTLTNESIKCKIVALHKYPTFKELYEKFDSISIGYNEGDEVDYHDMEQYYQKDKILKYGVLGIELELLN